MLDSRHPYDANRADFERNEHRNVFIMMRFAAEPLLKEIEDAIKTTLRGYGLNAILARDVAFDEELWSNIRFCMDHSRYAIVVFDALTQPSHNPNITLELGYMLALRRPSLILKDRYLPTLTSDIIGRLYISFDSHRANETVCPALESWLQKLGHKPAPSAQTISGTNQIAVNKERTERILEAISGSHAIIRQAAGLSSLAISDRETHEQDDTEEYQRLLLRERNRILDLLAGGSTVRIIICPELQVERAELKLVSPEHGKRNVLPRFDQLIKVIQSHRQNSKLQIVTNLRLPHDNLLVVDNDLAFIGRKRRRDRGIPYTTLVFDPVVVQGEISEFDLIFHDSVSALLGTADVEEKDYGSQSLKDRVLDKLVRDRKKLQRSLREIRSPRSA